MANTEWTWQRNALLATALAVLVLGVFSALEAPHFTYTGFSLSGRRVTRVDEGSPAAAAGLRSGEIVHTVTRAQHTWPRSDARSHPGRRGSVPLPGKCLQPLAGDREGISAVFTLRQRHVLNHSPRVLDGGSAQRAKQAAS